MGDNCESMTFTLAVNPISGELDLIGTGSSGSPANSYTTSFTSASLSGGILTVTHNLGVQHVLVAIYDDSNNLIPSADQITATSTNVLTIDLNSFTLNGTWNVRVIG